jgi:SAM-dependent methyltransferase
MLSIASAESPVLSDAAGPAWLTDLLGAPLPVEGGSIDAYGRSLTLVNGILRARELVSPRQEQTKTVFGFKWSRRDVFEGAPLLHLRHWLTEKYGDIAQAHWFEEHGSSPVLLDAGCGAAMSALALLEPMLTRIRYIGSDVSTAVDIARARFVERGLQGAFLQVDLQQLPFPKNSIDIIFSEGVLHHTDDTRSALTALVHHLKIGGRILFYVYRVKGPVREFTDDYVRERLQGLTPQEAWDALMPLTKLGKALGDADCQIEVPEAVDLLGIPAGRITVQRLFYWSVCKAFYRPELTLDEMNNINFDWFAPRNAHRQTPEQVRMWCKDLSLLIEREFLDDAGIAIIARKQ